MTGNSEWNYCGMHAESNLRLRHCLPVYVVSLSLTQMKIKVVIKKVITKQWHFYYCLYLLYLYIMEIPIKILWEQKRSKHRWCLYAQIWWWQCTWHKRKTRHSGVVVITAFRRLDKKITKISYKRERWVRKMPISIIEFQMIYFKIFF